MNQDSDYVNISFNELNVPEVIEKVSLSECGATSLFIGTTKNIFDGRKVIRLEYEAYTSMALKEMQKICVIMRQRWLVQKTAIVHRVGVVKVGEASIIVAASSEHRKDAQEAVVWALDAVKETVPIWKKEIYEDGSKWKENKECPWGAKS